jgi:hypothetical protein
LGHERLTQDQKRHEIMRNAEKSRTARFPRKHKEITAVAEVRSLLRG